MLFNEGLFLCIPLIVLLPALATLLFSKTEWIFFALVAALPLSTELNFTPSLGLDFPAEILMILLTGAFVLKLIVQPSILPKKVVDHHLFFLLVLHLLWITVSLFFSVDMVLSTKYLLAKSWYIIPFVILPTYFLNDKIRLKRFAVCLLWSMAIVITQALIRHAYLGFSFESVKNIYDPFFRNHVNFSGMLVCVLAIAATAYNLTKRKSRLKKTLLIAITIGLLAVFLAYSRGAWLALMLGVIAWGLIKKKLVGWSIALTSALIILVGTWLMHNNNYLHYSHDFNTTVFHENFAEHLQATVQFKDVSNAERFYRWIAGINMISDKPVTGFGPNNFYNSYKPYTELPFKTWVSNNPEHSSVHNYFLLTAIEQGVPGLIIFCALYFAMIVYSQKLYHSISDPFYKQIAITTGVVLVMIGALIFMSDLIETDKIGSLFWLCLGLLIVLREKQKSLTD